MTAKMKKEEGGAAFRVKMARGFAQRFKFRCGRRGWLGRCTHELRLSAVHQRRFNID
jgi:hypothetical protein